MTLNGSKRCMSYGASHLARRGVGGGGDGSGSSHSASPSASDALGMNTRKVCGCRWKVSGRWRKAARCELRGTNLLHHTVVQLCVHLASNWQLAGCRVVEGEVAHELERLGGEFRERMRELYMQNSPTIAIGAKAGVRAHEGHVSLDNGGLVLVLWPLTRRVAHPPLRPFLSRWVSHWRAVPCPCRKASIDDRFDQRWTPEPWSWRSIRMRG